MGQPLDSTRDTRFPDTFDGKEKSRQRNLRELEDAIVWLQDENERKDSIISSLNATVDALSSRIDILESES